MSSFLRHLIHYRRWLVYIKRPWSIVGCVALLGLLSCYFFFRVKRINANRPTSTATTSSTTTGNYRHSVPKIRDNSNNSFPRLADLTKTTVVSLSTQGIILNKSLEEQSANLAALRLIASKADLYLITRCDEGDTVTYEHVHDILKTSGFFDTGFNPFKHLSCSTVIGKAHIARQLDSKIHIDDDEEVITHLQRFTPFLMLINNKHNIETVHRGAGGAFIARSLQQQFHK